MPASCVEMMEFWPRVPSSQILLSRMCWQPHRDFVTKFCTFFLAWKVLLLLLAAADSGDRDGNLSRPSSQTGMVSLS